MHKANRKKSAARITCHECLQLALGIQIGSS
jgi:hypothetical protein